jgi:hypothetical protein
MYYLYHSEISIIRSIECIFTIIYNKYHKNLKYLDDRMQPETILTANVKLQEMKVDFNLLNSFFVFIEQTHHEQND